MIELDPDRELLSQAAGFRNQAAAHDAATLELSRCRRYGRRQQRVLQRRASLGIGTRVRRIYKICSASAWREAERQGVYRGSADDLRDGFIHFSSSSQLADTAKKHFFGQTALFLIEVDADALGEALRWEVSRNDELFPHLYGELDLGAVTAVLDMHARSDGTHEIPELTP
jgi:uncharacterized protein (DUF952 family)